MNALADRFAAEGVGFIFLYTNEAHPGEYYSHLTSMPQKERHARALRDELGVTRPILLDALDGALHRAYGSMPNMSWIFTRGAIPVYKADWTNAESIANTVEYCLAIEARRRAGAVLAPFHVERLDFKAQDRERFYEGLARNGPSAVREYREAFG